MSTERDRDLAGEATVREAYLERLRSDISADEANDEMEERERNSTGVYDYDEPSDYELDCYYAERDAQYRAYHS